MMLEDDYDHPVDRDVEKQNRSDDFERGTAIIDEKLSVSSNDKEDDGDDDKEVEKLSDGFGEVAGD